MRKVTKQSVDAFYNSRPFKHGNTKVIVLPSVTILELHGNAIAYRYNDPDRTLSITNCGWASAVTRERLNGLQGVNIQQKKFIWYLNGEQWDGKLIDIKSK